LRIVEIVTGTAARRVGATATEPNIGRRALSAIHWKYCIFRLLASRAEL